MIANRHLSNAQKVLLSLGLPREQQNERSALCLLALLNLTPKKEWAEAESPLLGITPIMDWVAEHYHKRWKPNTRETVRRRTMHQFVDAGIAVHNPDRPGRPVNSPAAVYQIEPSALKLTRSFGTRKWHRNLSTYLSERQTLAARYAGERKQNLVPVQIAPGKKIVLSPGEHSELIRRIIEDFGARYVTAFPNRTIMGRYLGEISWETEVWVADAPSHLIHFNGERFLGPYSAAVNAVPTELKK